MVARSVMADLPYQQQLIAALLDPRRYPHPAKTVRVMETHISWVLLAGRYAYKIKKAVDLGFLDFTTLDARQRYCAEELRLNRRLAPRLYLDVVAIGGAPDDPQLGSRPAIEYAVKMRRFGASALLEQRLARGQLVPQHIDRLAATLAEFHSALPPAAADTAYGSAASIRSDALQNFEQLQELAPDEEFRMALAAARQASEHEYSACAEIFEQRRAQGCVRECHGDLHLGNVALIGDKPLPFDGIEFNPQLRWIDVISEIAFLHMDLLHHGQAALAFRFLNAWLERTGDYAGVAVLRFYCAYRAMVRAKIGAIRARQSGLAGQAQNDEFAASRSYLELAARCLVQRSPALLITHGLPGSGKTTFAQAALERLQAIRIRSDVERKRLYGLQAHEDSRSAVGRGIYAADATAKTYARLRELARQLLAAGFPVIVDAAFLKREERESFRTLAEQTNVPFAIASLQATDATLRARIAQRQTEKRDASEAGLEVLEKLQRVQEPLSTEELSCTASFSDEAGNGFNDAASWHDLQALIGLGF